MPSEAPAAGRRRLLQRAALAALVVQNSALIVAVRCSRTAASGQQLYLASTVVLLTEALKLLLSLALLYKVRVATGIVLREALIELILFCLCAGLVVLVRLQETDWNREQFLQTVKQALRHEPDVFLRLCVPALLYTVQNNLQYLALSNLSAAAYQVLSQLKIFTTAVLSVMFLGKSLSHSQWFALVLLMLGVCIVQYQASQSSSSSNMTGFLAVVAATSTSGFCAVYLEKVLKAKGSIWVRNIQMAIIGLASSSLAALLQDGSNISQLGFFHGYTSIVWTVILLNAGGGLIVALVVKYADNILKGFATSVSIIMSCVASALLADFVVTSRFLMGAALVLVAVALYTIQDLKHRPQKQVPSKV